MRKLPARKLLGAMIASALLIPYKGFSLGLGEIDVNSALNQKLNADIELLSAAPEDTETLIVKLASRKEFSRAGLDRPYLLNDLRFKSEVINGIPYIKVSSGSPIREPFLNFLIEVDWPNGHLIREYTVLLDPPSFMTQQQAAAPVASAAQNSSNRPSAGSGTNVVPVVAPGVSVSPRPASGAQAPVAEPAAVQSAPAQTNWIPAPVLQQQATINQPPGSYKIKSGDTAWSLASAMRPDQSITVPQMMIALLRNNPESFIDDNVNGLKRGYILRVPEYNDIASINPNEAVALVREQAALWREYQASLAGGQPVSAMPADAESDDMGSAGAVSGEEGSDDAYLEIVSAGSGASTSGKDPTEMTAAELRAELSLARERIETEQVEKEALQGRIDTLEQRVDKMKGMLSIEDAELAEVQSLNLPEEGQTGELEVTEEEMTEGMPVESAVEEMQDGLSEGLAESEPVAEEAEMEGAEADETEMMDEGLEQGGEEATEETAVFVDEMSAEEGMSDKGQMEETVVEVEQVDVEPVVVEPQIVNKEPTDPLTQLLNNPMLLAAAGGGLLLIAALIGLIIKRRKAATDLDAPVEIGSAANDLDDLESLADDIAEEAADEAPAESLAGDSEAGEESFDSEATMILDSADDTVITEAQDEAEAEEEPRDDVIAEADVYLAYGIYQQAEELLTQAISDNPDRDDYRMKLAETHYASKDAEAFTRVAEELRGRIDDDTSPKWKKVLSMGQDLCADNPMFQGSMVGTPDVASLAPEAPEMDFDLGMDESEGESPDLDLSLDDEPLELPEVEDEEGAPAETMDELEFDLSDTGAVEETAEDDDEFSLDIDASELDIDIKDETEEDSAAEAGEDAILDLGDVDLGLDEAEEKTEDVVEDSNDLDLDFGLDDAAEDKASEGDADEEISLDLTDEAEALDIGEETVILDSTDTEETIAEMTDTPAAEESAAAASDDEEEDFDLSNLDDVDEVSTKLDLARAYLDMGDHEGSRGILEEVMAEGDDEQKKEASELMSKLD